MRRVQVRLGFVEQEFTVWARALLWIPVGRGRRFGLLRFGNKFFIGFYRASR